jgi:hypothetical protein
MPLSEKRKKHLERQAKRQARLRTREERLEKIDEVFDNFQRTGFPPTPEIRKFFQICKKWIEDGQLTQGIIPVPSLNIEICYTLNNSKLHDVGVMIRHTGQGPPPALGRPQEPVPVVQETTEPVVEETTEVVSEPVLSELDQIDGDDDDDDEDDDTVPELVSTTEINTETNTETNTGTNTETNTETITEEKQEETMLSKLTSMINPLNWTSNSK